MRGTSALLVLVLLGGPGCFNVGKGQHALETYVFDPLPTQTGSVDGSGPVLLVNFPRALAAYDTTRIAYVERPHEIAYYAYNQWSDTPPRMIEPLLIQSLESTGRFAAVVRASGSGLAELRLDTDILELVHDFIAQPSEIRLGVRVQLYDLVGRSVLGTRIIEVSEQAPTDDAYGCVRATNRALAEVLDQIDDFVVGAAAGWSPPLPEETGE
jgi:cholesterol transport system auxiliary component